ncbi:MAG: ABC transporter permease [Chloroflexi bacterium]|nr:MAG: ABC transporter permease [Chloroflexota bacterium]MBL1194714.1 ABC transporter permease [Chloroflexota bacterium]NOH12007.1 ABC transporter permease [Chloroflexota bacterium]
MKGSQSYISVLTSDRFSGSKLWRPVLAALVGLLAGGLFLLFSGEAPLRSYRLLLTAGFGCGQLDNCSFWTTLQFATPLMLAGLSAAVAFRAGVFSIGQAGQMVLGAGFAAWVAYQTLPAGWHPLLALLAAAVAGAIWGVIPGLLKVGIGVNEIISSIVLNAVAGFLVGFVPLDFGTINQTAQLSTLAPATKLNQGFFIALIAVVIVYLYLWSSAAGYRQRMVGQAPGFARYGGYKELRTVTLALLFSGSLAGLAGAIEVLGVHYRFLVGFSADENFDGILVALLGQSHPLGIVLAAIFVGGVRLGALNGLQIQAGIPRELGNVMLAVMALLMAGQHLFRINAFGLRERFAALRSKF